MEDEEEDERREAAIATRASLQPNFKPDGVSQSQLSKFQVGIAYEPRNWVGMRYHETKELHRRRLQIKAKSKIKKKAKGEILVGISGENSKSRVKNLDANDVTEEISSKETDHSSVSILKGNTTKDTFSQQQENVAVHIGTKKRQKLHWGYHLPFKLVLISDTNVNIIMMIIYVQGRLEVDAGHERKVGKESQHVERAARGAEAVELDRLVFRIESTSKTRIDSIKKTNEVPASMLYALSVPKTCISYPRNPIFHPRHLGPTRLRVLASLPDPDGVKVEYTPWLIVGLGNPGNKYHGTRHNVGFEMIDHLSQAQGILLNTIQSKALFGIGSIGEVPILLAKPQAYMNFSGESVGPLAAYYQVPLRHILLVYDDMSLPNGVLRLQPKGGHGHHNGVKSVMDHLDGCREFPRLCIGIGNPPGNMDMKAYLLQKFSSLERELVDEALQQGVDAVRNLVLHGFNSSTTRFNLEQKYKYHKV
ncbi:hypothetical protein TEA_011660 [Camellia sinensis var. sinensis]|uniref:Uncharacterized protein n=2 Tax=Camellia sinensis TaxID=4442 RepID=A0A4S4F2P4_CAMSN|nr:hypothetical protein TEA_011660 [Camellia sinensis var. sinensis]